MSNQKMLPIILCLTTLAISSTVPVPPLWPQTFHQDFMQSDSRINIPVSGKLWYDVKNNRQRMDLTPDYYDVLCQSVGQYANTSCSQIIVNDALYIILPEKSKCCKCCTAAQGCTVEPRDWLKDFKYVGEVDIKGENFNKWTFSGENYLASEDQQHTPRRIQAETYAIDFVTTSYSEEPISDSVFQLPTTCGTDCPKETMCGSYTEGKQKFSSLKEVFRSAGHRQNFSTKNLVIHVSTQ